MADLSSLSAKIEEVDEHGRFLFIDSDTDTHYHLGLVVTVKNQKQFCELKESNGEFRVIVSNLDSDSSIMEFNFFVLHKETRRGIYQHYHQSCSVGQAMLLIQKHHKSLVHELRNQRVSELQSQGSRTDRAEKTADKEYSERLKWSQLVRKEALAEILEELKEIKSLEVDLLYLEPDGAEFNQLSGLVRRQRRKFTFAKLPKLNELIPAITSVVNTLKIHRGKIAGVDTDGIDRFVKIKDNPDVFGEYDYDEVAKRIDNLEVKTFSKSWVIGELLRVCKANTAMFESPNK